MTPLSRSTCSALALLAAPAGCAPLSARATIDEASLTLRRAEEAGAMRVAAYQIWSARAYLEGAREARGRSDLEGATALARLARAWAAEALAKGGPHAARAAASVESPR